MKGRGLLSAASSSSLLIAPATLQGWELEEKPVKTLQSYAQVDTCRYPVTCPEIRDLSLFLTGRQKINIHNRRFPYLWQDSYDTSNCSSVFRVTRMSF